MLYTQECERVKRKSYSQTTCTVNNDWPDWKDCSGVGFTTTSTKAYLNNIISHKLKDLPSL